MRTGRDIWRVSSSQRSILTRDPDSTVLAIIAAGLLFRFVLSATVGLGVDESYAVAVARQLSLSYFDHPPLHFWMVGLFARLVQSEWGVVLRLPFVLCFAGTTWLTYRLGARLFGGGAGAIAALLLNVSAVFSLSTGGWVLPDGPLMLLMLAAVSVLTTILFPGTSSGKWPVTVLWLAAGLFTGLAMLTKYHGVFVLSGALLFLVSSPPHRRHLVTPGPYLGALVAVACLAPVVLWNREHGWVSFLFQGGRAIGRPGLHVDTFLANIGGQMAWVLPWIFVPLAASLWRSARSGPRDAARWFLFCIAIGPIAVFTLIALRGDVGLPHWQAPGWLFMFPALGAAVADRLERGEPRARRWLVGSVVGYLVLVAVLASQSATGWLARAVPAAFAKGDPTIDLLDWREVRPVLDAKGWLPRGGFVAAPSWIQAGKAAIGVGPDWPVLCLCSDPHHFRYTQDERAWLGHDAVLLVKHKEGDDVVAKFSPYFASVTLVGNVPLHRHGHEAMVVDVYAAANFRKLYPTDQPR